MPARGAINILREIHDQSILAFGRSGAGKTTLALKLRDRLADWQISVVYLDGDEMRATLCSDLGFNSAARLESLRRIAIIARLLAGQGLNGVVSTLAPEHQPRDLVSQILHERLVWFYIHAPLEQEDYCNTVAQNIEASFQSVLKAAKVHLSDSDR